MNIDLKRSYIIMLELVHTYTCMSESFSFSASSPRSAEDRYFFSWNFFSRSPTCSREKAVRGFFLFLNPSSSSSPPLVLVDSELG